jgi:4'-phosphopantetheinyl transferase
VLDQPAAPLAQCWSIAIDDIDERGFRAMSGMLDDAERRRADRFHRDADRHRSIAARAGLRLVLAEALGRRPAEISLVAGAAGKPALADGAVEFNVSHSGRFVVIALSDAAPIGIDVEEVRTMSDRDAIARHYFHLGEVADLRSLDEPEATLAFFRCWTRKEAVSKALGLGLGLALDSYRVACLPEEPATLREMAGEAAPERWSIRDLALGADHAAAVASPVAGLQVTLCRLDQETLLGGTAAPGPPAGVGHASWL